jgi:hypothetical protein
MAGSFLAAAQNDNGDAPSAAQPNSRRAANPADDSADAGRR